MAQAFGARVYDFAWTGDVSAALNYSLSKASGDWIFLLEPDEVVSPQDLSRYKDLVSRKAVGPAAYAFTTKYPAGSAGQSGRDTAEYPVLEKKVRLFTRHNAISFESTLLASIEPSLQRLRIEVKDEPLSIINYAKKVWAANPEHRGDGLDRVDTGSGESANGYPTASRASGASKKGLFASGQDDARDPSEAFIPHPVSMVILTYNEMEYTKKCVESVRRHTPEPHEIIFVDNGSKDGTVQWLQKLVQEHGHYKLIENRNESRLREGLQSGNRGGAPASMSCS